MTLAGRMRLVYTCNIVLPGLLAVLHLAAPRTAAIQLWQGQESLAIPMLGAWWAAVALLSVAGLRQPLKFSPIMLAQVLYKVAFLSAAILPRMLQGRWSEFCAGPASIYAAYLPLLLACAPWAYLLGAEDAGGEGRKIA